MEFEYSLISEPPGDDVRTLKPLPCYGRGLPLIPLEELPLFQYLKRDYEMAQPVNASREVPSGIGRGSVSKLSGFSMEDSSDEDHNVVSLYWRHQKPLSTSNLNAGLEPSRPAAQGKNHAPCRSPAASHPRARGRGRGIRTPGKRRLQQMLKQPQESQPSNNGARLRCPPHVSGPPPSCPGQLQMPPSSRHPALSKPRQECAFPPTKSFPRGKTAADAGRQAQGQSCRTSCPRKPIKKGSFDPKTFSHAVDLCSWVESLSNVEPHKHTTESGTELTDSNGDEFHRRVSIKPDSVYESFSSSSVSSTDLAYVSAVDATPAAPPVPAAPPAPEAVASVPENAQMSSLRGTEVLIKGLPKATTAEFVYYNTACFAAVDDVIISTDGDGTSADIILTKPYSASKLCQCLQAVLTLDGRSNRLEFSCLKQA